VVFHKVVNGFAIGNLMKNHDIYFHVGK